MRKLELISTQALVHTKSSMLIQSLKLRTLRLTLSDVQAVMNKNLHKIQHLVSTIMS